MSPLSISAEYVLPDSIVTETVAMLAKRGMGKSNAAVVMAEEMYHAGFQWVAIDPKGDWWGIRASSNGKNAGLPVPIFGGRHGDVPLEASAGQVMANLIIERGLTCVLDVSLFSKGDQIRFVTDFAETLFRAIGDDPRPLHLFLEEAEEFLPQRVDARSARMVGAYSKISKQGRTLGLGVTLITQRSASLNKDALSQTDTLVLFRTVSPHDRKAVVAWTEHHDESKEVAETLSELKPGESWIVSPGFLGSVERINWRRRSTFDSGATPVAGARRKAPVTLADIDLGEINERIADTIERAKADDPKELKRKVAELERQLALKPEPSVQTIEVPVVTDEQLLRFETAVGELRKLGMEVLDGAADLVGNLPSVTTAPPRAAPKPEAAVAVSKPRVPSATASPASLPIAQRKILSVLAQHGRRTVTQVALLTGYSHKGGGFRNALGALRSNGFVEGRGEIEATQDGLDALGDWEPLPSGRALVDWWCRQLGKAEREVLQVLVDAWPSAVSVAELAEKTGYSAAGGGFRNSLGRLRSLQLASGRGDLVAADELGAGAS